MAVYNLGSINADHVYEVPHLPQPGETLAATGFSTGLGGKGANQSVAVARAGSRAFHIGAVGADGRWAVARLADCGVDVRHVAETDTATGHAIITVDRAAENAIVLFPGANMAQTEGAIQAALAGAGPGDTLMLQNETSLPVFAARRAREMGLEVFYSAAPFDVAAVRAVLPHITTLALNGVEAKQLQAELETDLASLGVAQILVTRGAGGAEWHVTGNVITTPAFPVEPVDTTGAGDTFAGYLVAAFDQGLAADAALRLASAAAAIKVTRLGAASAIPTRAETDAFLADQS